MNKKLLYLLLTVIVFGCKNSSSVKTYFGGKIINPKSRFIIIGNHLGVVDTVNLNDDNTFTGTLENINEGLYYFEHGPELQYIYLEPKDSLLIRLNTWDFDESLVFSGVNAGRNNALLTTFLQNEKDKITFNQYYNTPFKEFKKKVKDLKTEKDIFLKKYIAENNEKSKTFLELLEIALLYPTQCKLEVYSIYNIQRKKPRQIDIAEILENRKKFPLKRDSLLFFPSYRGLTIRQIYNDTYLKGHKKNTDNFTVSLLENINTKVLSSREKNRFLFRTTIGSFSKKTSDVGSEKTFETFLKLNTDKENEQKIKLLINDTKNAIKNQSLNNFKVTSVNDSIKNISEIIQNKKTALYFRNIEQSSDEWVSGRINFLAEKHPKVNFYIINIGGAKKSIKNVDNKYLYYLTKNSQAHKFLKSENSRLLLVDKNGTITNNFSGLLTHDIEKLIEELEQK